MKLGKRILSCFLSFALAVTMMCGLFTVGASAAISTISFVLPTGGSYPVTVFDKYSGGGIHASYIKEYILKQGQSFPGAVMDIAASKGTQIYAMADGVVKENNNHSAGGYNVVIRHELSNGGTGYTYYGHMLEKSSLKVGDKVTAGQLIGYVGMTGSATGYHLHFECSFCDAYCSFRNMGINIYTMSNSGASVYPHDHGGLPTWGGSTPTPADPRGYYLGVIPSRASGGLVLHSTPDYNDSSAIATMPNGSLVIRDSSKDVSGTTKIYMFYKGMWGYASSNYVDSTSSKIDASNFSISYSSSATYNGSYIYPSVSVSYYGMSLIQGTDYTLQYSNNLNAGTGQITITGCGNLFTGSKTVYFTIYGKNVSNLTVSTISDQIYTGSALTPAVTVMDGTNVLTNGTDYTVAYSNNTAVGTATVTITGKGNYTGTVTKNFAIVKNTTIEGAVDVIEEKDGRIRIAGWAFDSNSSEDQVLISYTLLDGTGYQSFLSIGDIGIGYTNVQRNDVNSLYGISGKHGFDFLHEVSASGTYTVVVNANEIESDESTVIGTGTVSINDPKYSISGATVTIYPREYIYTGSQIKPDVTITKGNETLILDKDYTLEYENNINAGTAKVYIYGKGKYDSVKEEEYFIYSKSLSNCTISSIADQTYTGSAITPAVTVKDGTKTLTNGTDYTVTYSNNTAVGTATVTIAGKGNYIGTQSVTFKIVAAAAPTPPTVTVTPGDGQVTLKWNAVTGATKYAVSIYENGKYTVLNQKLTTNSYTATGLTNGKEYKFLVQAYNGKWSSASTKYLVSETPVSPTPAVTVTPGDGQVTFKWNAVSGATKYAVSIYENGKYTVLSKTITGTTYTAKSLTNGKEYKFLVQAYTGKWSSASTKNLVSVTPVPPTPFVTATPGDGQVTLKWNTATGATKYAVSIYENGKYTVLSKTITGTTYTAKSLTNGKEYKFLVQAYTGKWSSTSTDCLISATPTGGTIPVVTSTAGDGQVTFKWKAVTGATKYAVSIYENGKYTVLSKTITGTTYTAKNLTNGKEYKFLVQAYTGKWSSTSTDYLVSATPKGSTVPVVTVTPGDELVMLKWNAVSGATKYAVSIYENGKYTVLNKAITKTSYIADGLTNGKEYKFLVQAYNGKWSSTSTDYLVSATPEA